MARTKTSFAQQAENKAALAQAVGNLNAVITAAGLATQHALPGIGLDLVNRVKRSLSKPGGGRIYHLTDPSRVHRASRPGRPPATDLSGLKNSYVMAVLAPTAIEVGTSLEYAPFLEFGTRRMKPRPHFRPAVLEVKASIAAEMAAAIIKAEKQAIAGLRGGILKAGRAF